MSRSSSKNVLAPLLPSPPPLPPTRIDGLFKPPSPLELLDIIGQYDDEDVMNSESTPDADVAAAAVSLFTPH